ncbi:hypothetical protein PR048_011867 [Dryococelus australis]|uniref:DUF4371 domain-containing protein n=1 Tax=Dryococelus australis TaxID=614101 RepID=A0ABQ9HNF3_9NEOP|nr:hypothetical protein PR048_011867 [Dryococelus australis]
MENMIISLKVCEQQKKNVIEESRKKLIPIIKTVIFCGALNIPLTGHRDDGDLQTEPEKKYGEGNFRALLKFRIDAGDEILASHSGLSDKNASYISNTNQNEIIQCCGDAITEKIFAQIKNTKYFTIIVYETTDISIKEKLAICIRYFDTTSYEIREKFFRFIDVVDVSHNLQELNRLNLHISYCRGQAYDGVSNMSGKFKGVQARIATVQPLAIYSHYANHRLNLAISKAYSVASIRNTIGLPQLKKGKHAVKMMWETRWFEKHDTGLTFLDTLPCLPVALETTSESSESKEAMCFHFFTLYSRLSSLSVWWFWLRFLD